MTKLNHPNVIGQRFGRNLLSTCPMCDRTNVLAPADDPSHGICGSCWEYSMHENGHSDNSHDVEPDADCIICQGVTPQQFAAPKPKTKGGKTGPRVEPVSPLSIAIRTTREALGLSRPDLSRRCGVSVASIHSLEHERTPRDGEVDKVAQALQAVIVGLGKDSPVAELPVELRASCQEALSPTPAPTPVDYAAMTSKELQAAAKIAGVKNIKKHTKAQLVELLSGKAVAA